MEHSSSSSHDNRQFLQRIDRDVDTNFCLRTRWERVPLILWHHQMHDEWKEKKEFRNHLLTFGVNEWDIYVNKSIVGWHKKRWLTNRSYKMAFTREKMGWKATFSVGEDNCQMAMFIVFLCQSEMCRVRYENYVKHVNRLASITWAFELLIVQIGHVLSLQLTRWMAASVRC